MQEKIPILENDYHGHVARSARGARRKTHRAGLDALEAGEVRATPQSAEGDVRAKLGRGEARVDWRESAVSVNRRVRAFNPSPGADARVARVELKIWRCATAAGQGNQARS